MPYADVNSPLPWWAQQNGQPQSGQATPPGYGGTSWLNYLASMFAPGAAQAGGVDANGRPQSATDALRVALANPNAAGAGPADVPVPPSVNSAPIPPAPQPAPAQPQPDPVGDYVATVGNHPSWPTTSMGSAPRPQMGPPIPPGGLPANQPSVNAQPVNGPMGPGGAGAMGATSNPRFVQLDQGQNADPTSRNRGGPQMTALNLGGLFGGGAQGSPSAAPMGRGGGATPYGVSQTADPRFAVGTPDFSNIPDDAFDQNGKVIGPMGRKKPSALAAAASLKQRYG
jgi:hypothetical protein